MSRQHGTPYFVTDTTSRSLQPVKDLDEKWLQKFFVAYCWQRHQRECRTHRGIFTRARASELWVRTDRGGSFPGTVRLRNRLLCPAAGNCTNRGNRESSGPY